MEYEKFKKYVTHLKEEFDFEMTLLHAGISIDVPQIDNILNDELELLRSHFEDGDDWISYFIYELDFGTKCKLGTIYDDRGSIKLETPIDLYYLLNKNPRYYEESF